MDDKYWGESKASVALYCYRGAIVKRLGLSPKMVFWLYEIVVKPIIFYGVFGWWRAFEKATLAQKLKWAKRWHVHKATSWSDSFGRQVIAGQSWEEEWAGSPLSSCVLSLDIWSSVRSYGRGKNLVGHKLSKLHGRRWDENIHWFSSPFSSLC